MDPISQIPGYGQLLYSLGALSPSQRDNFIDLENQIVSNISAQNFFPAFQLFDSMLNGDFYPYPTLFFNYTGLTDYYNFLQPQYPPNPWEEWINAPANRASLHVGTRPFTDGNSTVEWYLRYDWMVSVRPKIEHLLNTENYKVLVYSGQNDIILSPSQCEQFLQTLNFPQIQNFNSIEPVIWKINETDIQIAGYARAVQGFTYVIVRNAGHLLPQDQPDRALDMITRFIENKPFN